MSQALLITSEVKSIFENRFPKITSEKLDSIHVINFTFEFSNPNEVNHNEAIEKSVLFVQTDKIATYFPDFNNRSYGFSVFIDVYGHPIGSINFSHFYDHINHKNSINSMDFLCRKCLDVKGSNLIPVDPQDAFYTPIVSCTYGNNKTCSIRIYCPKDNLNGVALILGNYDQHFKSLYFYDRTSFL